MGFLFDGVIIKQVLSWGSEFLSRLHQLRGEDMKKTSKVILAVLVVLYCYLAVHFKPWNEFKDKPRISDIMLASAAIIILAGLIVCAAAMIFGKKQARKPFIFFNLVYLAFGLYVTHVAWTLWIFRTPTLMDRIRASVSPFLVGVVIPVAVMIYFIKREKG